MKNFLKFNRRKLIIVLIFIIITIITIIYKINYLDLLFQNPLLFIDKILGSIFALFNLNFFALLEVILVFIVELIWFYLISCIIDYIYLKNKKFIIIAVIILVVTISTLNLSSITTNSDKTMFVNALKQDNTSLCLNIHKYAKVTGDEFNSLVYESKNYSLQVMGRTDKFPLRDLCLKAVQTGIELKSLGIDHTKN